jgi:hypothetical protein
MASMRFQSDEEMPARTRSVVTALIEAAKPTLTAMLIVIVLLSVWIGLRAA